MYKIINVYLYLWFTFIFDYGIVYIVKNKEEIRRGYKNAKSYYL